MKSRSASSRLISLFLYSLVGLFFYSLIPLFPNSLVHAQESAWFAPTLQEFGATLDESQKSQSVNKEAYDTATQVNQMAAMACQITGCSDNPKSSFHYSKSTIAALGTYMGAMYGNPPANFALWMHHTAQTLGFEAKTAHAQGIGFAGLAGLLPVWQAFRNIAYLLLAIVLMVVGFMVMFRQKIDPKTVVTVQSALPKIVITLILVTFSYAIAGLLIDLMYLVMALGINILVSSSNGLLGQDTATKYLSDGVWALLGAIFNGGFRTIDDLVRLISYNGGYGFVGGLSWAGLATFTSPIIFLVLAIALLFGFIRIFFMLLMAYIQIIIAVIIGPLQLILEAIPGASGFSPWISNLISNLAVFPVTAIMLLLGTILARQPAEQIWAPPLLNIGGNSASGIIGLIGLGFIMTIPSVAGSIKEALKAKPAINAGPGAIIGPIGAGAGQLMQLGYQGSFIWGALKGHGGHSNPSDVDALKAAGAGKSAH